MLHIREHVPLRDLTTFRAGGPARFFCEVTSEAELVEALAFVSQKNIKKFFILGGGSNILVGDAGFDGLVILMNIKGVDFDENSAVAEVLVTAGAGENWDDFVGECVKRGLTGVENLSGIPGTVGAAPVQNIGAYGVEISHITESVRVLDTLSGEFISFSNKDCSFEYRDSVFKKAKGRYVIVSTTFALKKFVSSAETPLNLSYKDLANCDCPTPADVRAKVLSIRAAKLPDVRVVGTAGSFFKNPIICDDHFFGLKKRYPDLPGFVAGDGVMKVPLAWILDHICGYKGVTKGNVGTYKNQALVIVNNFSEKTGATPAEIRKFADEIAVAVKKNTDIDIEPEVQYIG